MNNPLAVFPRLPTNPRLRRGLLVGALTALVAVPALASPHILVKIAEIPGKTSQSGIDNAISATGVSMGLSTPTSADGDKIAFSPLTITKLLDSTTPKLMEAAGNQKVLKNVQINLVRTSNNATVKTVVTVPNAVVTDWRINDVEGSDFAVEQVTLRVDGLTITYEDVDAAGKKSTISGTVP